MENESKATLMVTEISTPFADAKIVLHSSDTGDSYKTLERTDMPQRSEMYEQCWSTGKMHATEMMNENIWYNNLRNVLFNDLFHHLPQMIDNVIKRNALNCSTKLSSTNSPTLNMTLTKIQQNRWFQNADRCMDQQN